MSVRCYVSVIVVELLTADRTDYVIGTRHGLFDVLWALLIQSQLTRLPSYIFHEFVIEEARVVLGELTLSLQLEDARAERCPHICVW